MIYYIIWNLREVNLDIIDKLLKFPESTAPIYSMPSANQSIALYSGEFLITQKDGSLTKEEGVIELAWLPTSNIIFNILDANHMVDTGAAILDIPDFSKPANILVKNLHISGDGSIQYSGIFMEPVVINKDLEVDQIVFHIANMKQFIGSHIREVNSAHTWLGRISLDFDNWQVYIDALPDIKNVLQNLNKQGGFAITHVGRIERRDKHNFSIDDVSKVLFGLEYFLSFVNGFWCRPILPVGLKKDLIVWQEWKSPSTTQWKTVRSWFPFKSVRESQDISRLFQGIMERLSDPLWSDAIKIAMHWFIEANMKAGGVEGAIVLTQTALELLGWSCLVEDDLTKLYSGGQFDRFAAEKKIRELLTHLHIPVDIPAELSNIRNFALAEGAVDGPSAIVKLRNVLVHPKQTKRSFLLQTPQDVRHDAHTVGMWFLELCLLRLFGYNGIYYPRYLWGFDASEKQQNVPWK